MKKFLLLTAATALFATSAFAANPPPTTIHCAVMPERTVNIKTATEKKMYTDYKGNRYFFCCKGCPGAFKEDPAKFAKNDHIAIPKDTTSAH